MSNSCTGCKFLYSQGIGYSNYTQEGNEVFCAKDRNPNLPQEQPYDWIMGETDNWPVTNSARCELYALGPMVCLDVGGEDTPSDHTQDAETIATIAKHSGRPTA